MVSRFSKQSDGGYIRNMNIDGNEYTIRVESSIWNTQNVTSHVNYWLKRKKLGKNPTLKYGTLTRTTDDIVTTHICLQCDKTYKSRSGLLRHIKKYHPPTERIEEPSNERTIVPVTNIANQTNNIQVNPPPLRNFNEENQKWLTHDVDHCGEYEFKDIANNFLNTIPPLTMKSFTKNPKTLQPNFKNRALARRWHLFHQRYSQLQCLCKSCHRKKTY